MVIPTYSSASCDKQLLLRYQSSILSFNTVIVLLPPWCYPHTPQHLVNSSCSDINPLFYQLTQYQNPYQLWTLDFVSQQLLRTNTTHDVSN